MDNAGASSTTNGSRSFLSSALSARPLLGCHCGILRETARNGQVSKPSVLVNFVQALVAIVLGNVLYFVLMPSLPAVAQHRPFRLDLGMLLDFWLCLVAYGLIRTARKWR